jgi:peptide/nickel transport system ATP-binding protein
VTEPLSPGTPLLRTSGACKRYGAGRHAVDAVRDVDLVVRIGRPVGVAGESGSGKSTLLRLLLDLEAPTSGTVAFADRPLNKLDRAQRRRYRTEVQAVFQDPGSSFSPRAHMWKSITEPAWIARGLARPSRRQLAGQLLTGVELPGHFADRLPHQLSGGERQRVAIARALSSNPHVVLLDEPVTSLDVSVRGAIINLLADRADQVTYVVVSHDLTVIAHLTDELLVMYRGLVVERGPTAEVLANPRHPYTQVLVSSVGNPLFQPPIDNDTPAPRDACPYLHRCPHAMDVCLALPEPRMTGEQETRCHLYDANPVAVPEPSLHRSD